MSKRKKVVVVIGLLVCMMIAVMCYIGVKDRSDIYTKADLKDAKEIVIDAFNNWPGDNKLITLVYKGDKISASNLDYCNQVTDKSKGQYDQCAVFKMSFKSGKTPLVFAPNSIYTGYEWFLARTDGGAWEIVQCGYP